MASSVLSALSNQALLYRLASISHLPNPAIFSISFPKASRTRRSLVRPIAIVGWRLVEVDSVMRLQCEWRLRDAACGEELISRINKVLENTGHYPNISLEQPNIVKAELYTPSIGGLSINDFIIGAKIDKVKVLDLLPRKRVWA
ncbi:Transcriptional coactivator/pterin dehydratase [Rhynchospora pubera]|uniref:4a-hydroxytetrahydrobiopterin dehydratase n=1 Tax=Rhynchospora pubera TaxID=906938 RepID=A0AAV8F2W7_9POAL|nr:Transcriptional coactivator/pterin dehydratase [Rhynchospora pubera]